MRIAVRARLRRDDRAFPRAWRSTLDNVAAFASVLLFHELVRIRVRIESAADLPTMLAVAFGPFCAAMFLGEGGAALAVRNAARRRPDPPRLPHDGIHLLSFR